MRKIDFGALGLLVMLLLSLGGAASLSSCAEGVTHHPGWVTESIQGKMTLEAPQGQSPFQHAFVLVELQERSFLGDAESPQFELRAFLVRPDQEGRYRVRLSSATASLRLSFFARGHLVAKKEFDRTLGVGSYEFDPALKRDEDWLNRFYFGIQPHLTGYITDERFKMPETDQLFLGNWLKSALEK